jgi:hypothetical protein
LSLLEKENLKLSQKVDFLENEKLKDAGIVAELKRAELGFQIRVEKLESTLKYS